MNSRPARITVGRCHAPKLLFNASTGLALSALKRSKSTLARIPGRVGNLDLSPAAIAHVLQPKSGDHHLGPVAVRDDMVANEHESPPSEWEQTESTPLNACASAAAHTIPAVLPASAY